MATAMKHREHIWMKYFIASLESSLPDSKHILQYSTYSTLDFYILEKNAVNIALMFRQHFCYIVRVT